MKVLAAFQMMDSVLPDDARSLAALALRLGGTAGEGALLLCDAPPENGKGPALPGEIILYRVNRDEPFLPDSDSFRRALLACMEEFSPEIILLPHGTFYLPAAAAAARARGCRPVTGIESLQKQGEKFFSLRSVAGGAVAVREKISGLPLVLTLQPAALAGEETPSAGSAGRIVTLKGKEEKEGKEKERPFTVTAVSEAESDSDLDEAEVIVAAGRGIGGIENLHLIKDLARIFPRGAVGASRIVCDRGWLPYRHQVGITGRSVSPRLYLACGISGSSQHVAGMAGSRTVIAINIDPSAPVFQYARYGVTEDLMTFIPLLIDTYRNQKERR